MAENKIYIGTSGYYYPHWEKGVFYPLHLSKARQLEYYAHFFNTVELNVTFYRLPQEKTFVGWYKRTPDDFVFAVKGSRYITHIKRLKEVKEGLKNFFSRVRHLKEKMGVVLWQLPPNFKRDISRLKSFIEVLSLCASYRQAFEFRHQSWFCDEVFEMVSKSRASICIADWPGLDVHIPLDFPFIYLRRHGPIGEGLYSGCYTEAEIKKDAQLILEQYHQGKDVFVYFNNDALGYAVKNALELKTLLVRGLTANKCKVLS